MSLTSSKATLIWLYTKESFKQVYLVSYASKINKIIEHHLDIWKSDSLLLIFGAAIAKTHQYSTSKFNLYKKPLHNVNS